MTEPKPVAVLWTPERVLDALRAVSGNSTPGRIFAAFGEGGSAVYQAWGRTASNGARFEISSELSLVSERELMAMAEALNRKCEMAECESVWCPERHNGFVCTLAARHNGDHEAHGTNDETYERWPRTTTCVACGGPAGTDRLCDFCRDKPIPQRSPKRQDHDSAEKAEAQAEVDRREAAYGEAWAAEAQRVDALVWGCTDPKPTAPRADALRCGRCRGRGRYVDHLESGTCPRCDGSGAEPMAAEPMAAKPDAQKAVAKAPRVAAGGGYALNLSSWRLLGGADGSDTPGMTDRIVQPLLPEAPKAVATKADPYVRARIERLEDSHSDPRSASTVAEATAVAKEQLAKHRELAGLHASQAARIEAAIAECGETEEK